MLDNTTILVPEWFNEFFFAKGVDEYYTKYVIECDLLFGITQCYIYLLYISYFTNKCEIGSLDIIEH